ncbi:XRE family transcriptional regulator [Maritimibacter sp. DP1N21-5]|nr:XRE family transcriptional regulator [Maritimibacter sp. DP1N21-5]
MTQTRLAEAVGVSRGHMSLIISGQKAPSLSLLERAADALEVDISALYETSRTVPVAGRVGAGSRVELVDAFPQGEGLFRVACPEDLPSREVVAVEVEGDSMSPIIMPGDILFFTRNFVGIDENAVNRVSICETEDGRALVKLLRFGRDEGAFDLFSANNLQPPEYGVKLQWAAPLRRHIARQDVVIIHE